MNEFPVLKADGIKYIMIFRNQVSSCSFMSCLPLNPLGGRQEFVTVPPCSVFIRTGTASGCPLSDGKSGQWVQVKRSFHH